LKSAYDLVVWIPKVLRGEVLEELVTRSRRSVRAVPRPIGMAFADPAAIAAARASWPLLAQDPRRERQRRG
jgi:hypothetical protein